MKYIFKIVMFTWWIVGVVVAKGFWSTFFAFFIPFWAWYLTAETALRHWGAL